MLRFSIKEIINLNEYSRHTFRIETKKKQICYVNETSMAVVASCDWKTMNVICMYLHDVCVINRSIGILSRQIYAYRRTHSQSSVSHSCWESCITSKHIGCFYFYILIHFRTSVDILNKKPITSYQLVTQRDRERQCEIEKKIELKTLSFCFHHVFTLRTDDRWVKIFCHIFFSEKKTFAFLQGFIQLRIKLIVEKWLQTGDREK